MAPSFHYTAYGLNIESVLQCPELLPGEERPDVHIRYGHVPMDLDNPKAQGVLYQAKPNEFLLEIDGIARYLISDGTEIIIDRVSDSRDDEIRLFLCGAALGVLLLQRRLLPLHGSAIETPAGAVIFAGPSGIGKSALAGAFYKRGYRVLADEVSTIAFDEHDVPVVLPAYPQIMLWPDVIRELGEEPTALERVRPHLEKYALCIHDRFSGKSLRLHAVFALDTIMNTQNFSIESVDSFEKFQVFIHNTYRRHFLNGLGVKDIHFKQAVSAAEYAKVRRLRRSYDLSTLNDLVDRLEQDFI